ncbi:MAG: CoA pyrophosphatase [Alphaproteobacteria bacterium]|nr:CoA pyrophosphatase [Alphaproteobacteria bacterium]
MLDRRYLSERLRKIEESDPAWRAPAAQRRGDHELNPGSLAEAPRDLMPAAVLVPLVARAKGWTVLLTQRTDHLHHHAGQISFPGGRVEDGDATPVATALRESEEEIGLDRRHVDVVGALDTYQTGTGFLVAPIVGVVEPSFDLTLDAFEVKEAFEVPLAFVLDPANHQRQSRFWKGRERHFYVLPFENRYIWGATAGMLVNLHAKLAG